MSPKDRPFSTPDSTLAKLDELSNLIQESQLFDESGPVPLDPLKDRRNQLQVEVDTALQGIKQVAELLVKTGVPDALTLARQLIVYRSSLKLLAREHFAPEIAQYKRIRG